MSLGYDGPRDLLPFALRISSGTKMTGPSDDARQCRDSHHVDCDRIRSPFEDKRPCYSSDGTDPSHGCGHGAPAHYGRPRQRGLRPIAESRG
jgi:hypothetical protein